MITGDAGVAEYGLTPKGEIFKTPDKPTLMEAPKHTKIFPNEHIFSEYLKETVGNAEKKQNDIIKVQTVIKQEDFGQKKILSEIDRGIKKLRENEKYRLRLEKTKAQFKTW
jgi:uncharacterized protein YfeS